MNKIKLGLALGWSNTRIAAGLGISEPTLRKHYFSVLKVRAMARDALELRRAEKLWEQVERGNVGAMKAFDKLLADNDRMNRAGELRRSGGDDEAPEERPMVRRVARIAAPGKKELAVDAARAAVMADPDLQPGLPLAGQMKH